MSLNAVSVDQLGNGTVCDVSLVSASGTLSCVIPVTTGNGTLYATVSLDGVEKFSQIIDLGGNVEFGNAGYFLLLLLAIIMPLLFVASKTMTIIGSILGFVVASLFGFINGGVLAFASPIIWFMVVGFILIYKLNTEGKT